MPDLRRVFLVGPMGAGKTTIGKYLAQQLKLDFADTDSEIEARTGADIPWIFDVEGEEGFRQREEAMIAELLTAETQAGFRAAVKALDRVLTTGRYVVPIDVTYAGRRLGQFREAIVVVL